MRERITEELVYRLANELVALGKKVTNGTIRERNGDYGSPNDIQPYLKRWKQQKFEEEQKRLESERQPMPGHLEELFRPMWDGLCQAANREREQIVDEHAVEIAEKDAEIHEIGESLRTSDERQLKLEEEIESLKKGFSDQLELAQQGLDKSCQEVSDRDVTIEQLQKELADCNAEIEILERHCKEYRSEAKALKQAASDQQDTIGNLQGKLEVVEQQGVELKGQLSKKEKETGELVSRLQVKEDEVAALDASLCGVRSQLKQSDTEKVETATRLEVSESRVRELEAYRDRVALAEGKTEQQQNQIEQLNSKIESMITVREHRQVITAKDHVDKELKQANQKLQKLEATNQELASRLKKNSKK